jgi:hypothetical protein
MLNKIVTGGQTGADQAAWRAAKLFSVPTAGWMPRGFLTEDGPRPEFAQAFGAAELPTETAAARTERNVRDSDGTLWFGETTSAGAHDTIAACRKFMKPCLPVWPSAAFEPSHVAAWIVESKISVLNVAGNRESVEPGIGDRVERFLGQVLEQLSRQ